jgi:hypothetical protein
MVGEAQLVVEVDGPSHYAANRCAIAPASAWARVTCCCCLLLSPLICPCYSWNTLSLQLDPLNVLMSRSGMCCSSRKRLGKSDLCDLLLLLVIVAPVTLGFPCP